MDPYRTLGVSPGASDADITRAYRALAKKYHPDMNSGSRAAEQKMQEINAAYDQIKNMRSGGGSAGSSAGQARYGGFGGNGGAAGNGGFGGGRSAGFGDSGRQDGSGGYGSWYDPAAGEYRGYGETGRTGRGFGDGRDGGGDRTGFTPELQRVGAMLRGGFYAQALQALQVINHARRGALWFYMSAVANAGCGNRVTALDHAQEAVRLAPDNEEYMSFLSRLQRGGFAYSQNGASQGFDMRNMGRTLLQCFAAQMFCYYCLCCKPC